MARQSANSLLNSLKGKIWLATSALAFFICTFGIIAYLLVSFLVNETFYAVFMPFLFLSFIVMVFGWWLSNEVVSPIEKVALLAKSLERSATTSLPRTTGSSETDELLQTLHRSSQQTQTLVGLMDKVANGNLNVVLTPLQNSDRLSSSFQKLLAKVSESINAKQDLEKLQTEIRQINQQIIPVNTGDFGVEIHTDSPETKEIAETLRYLLRQLNQIITQVKDDSGKACTYTLETQKIVQFVIQESEQKVRRMNQVKLNLNQIPLTVQKIIEDLSGTVSSANQSIEKVRIGMQNARNNSETVNSLRRQIQESVKRIGQLSERSQEIGKVAKSVGDLAQRTNMIALNASIQASESNEQGLRYSILEEEVERLAARAENTNSQISSLHKSIAAEIIEVENSLQSTVSEIAKLSKFAIESGNVMGDIERYVAGFLNTQKNLISIANENSFETEQSFEEFVNSISEMQSDLEKLKESETNILKTSNAVENLQFAVVGLNFRKILKKFPP